MFDDYLKIVLGFYFFGSIFLISAILQWQQNANPPQWRKVRGSILDSTLIERKIRVQRRPDIQGYFHRIHYTYAVNEQSYTNNVFRSGQTEMQYTSHDTALKARHTFPPGTAVTVYYDPANPAYSVLDPRKSYTHVLLLLIGVILLGVAIFLSLIG